MKLIVEQTFTKVVEIEVDEATYNKLMTGKLDIDDFEPVQTALANEPVEEQGTNILFN